MERYVQSANATKNKDLSMQSKGHILDTQDLPNLPVARRTWRMLNILTIDDHEDLQLGQQ